MNILFLGQYYPPGLLKTFIEDTGGKVGFSNHNFEKSLIEGFASLPDVCLKIITTPLAFSYPRSNRRLIIRPEHFVDHGAEAVSVGFCNLLGINSFHKVVRLKKEIRKILHSFPEGTVHVVVNTPSYNLLAPLFKVADNSSRKLTTTLIVPDVAECLTGMDHHHKIVGALLDRINKMTAKYSALFDKYVFLTEQMRDFFQSSSSDYIVMEGLIAEGKIIKPESVRKKSDKEIILYAGTLRRIFGVMDLVEVYKRGDFRDCELWICGSGECAEEIKEAAHENPGIKFFGLVSHDEALRLQSEATILANPRNADGEYTKYSFPSKTIEYLLAGKTLIMNHLPGVPAEYDKYIEYPTSQSVDAWIIKLKEIFASDKIQRENRAHEARNFIINNKTAIRQCARIVNFIAGSKGQTSIDRY